MANDAIVGEFIEALVNDRQRAEALLFAQPDLLNARWMHDETVIHFLAVEGFLDAVTFLAERGADLSLANEFGDVPLIDIAALGFDDVAKVLLRHGADPNVRAGSVGRFNALDCAVRAGNSVLVEMLLRAGANANYVTDLGETIFDVLPESRNEREKILASLIPIDDALNAVARTDPSFNAEIRKRLAPVKDRFFAVPPSAHSDHLKDGLHTAPAWLTDTEMRRVAIELAEFALARGVDVNVAWDADGRSLLHSFVLLRDPGIAVEAVTWLLEHGADPNLPKRDGETPFQLALRHGRTEVVELLRTHGGR